MHQNRWRLGLRPGARWGAHDAPGPDPRVGLGGDKPLPRLHPSEPTAPAVYINDQIFLFTLLSHQSCFAVETLVTVYCL